MYRFIGPFWGIQAPGEVVSFFGLTILMSVRVLSAEELEIKLFRRHNVLSSLLGLLVILLRAKGKERRRLLRSRSRIWIWVMKNIGRRDSFLLQVGTKSLRHPRFRKEDLHTFSGNKRSAPSSLPTLSKLTRCYPTFILLHIACKSSFLK